MAAIILILIVSLASVNGACTKNKTVGISTRGVVPQNGTISGNGDTKGVLSSFFPGWHIPGFDEEEKEAPAKVESVPAKSCGQSSTPIKEDQNRIVGGQEATPFSHPWLVSLQQRGFHFCGGSLLHVGSDTESDIVLTAAHCVYDGVQQLTASAGAHDLNSPTDNQQKVAAADTIYYEQYTPGPPATNDLAIVKLATPIKFTSSAQPVCLPQAGENPAADTPGFVAGWGVTQEGGRKPSQILNQVSAPIISQDECTSKYQNYGFAIKPEAMICGGYAAGGMDTCQGDSGGPYVFKGDKGYVQRGVVSFGIGCARPNVPGVYTHVANYLDWINAAIQEHSEVAKKL